MKNSTQMRIPIASPQLGQLETEYVTQALRAGEISGTTGSFLRRFERDFASYCGCAHGIATSNGTAALHLALASLGIGPGDEVLVSTLTFMSSFFAVIYLGATPVPIDVEGDTWNLNPDLFEGLITPRTRAIVVVHLFGNPANMGPILNFARKHQLLVVEDAAEAHGALYEGRKVGSLGDVGCFSFFANKIVTTGEGGMVTTNDADIASRMRSLRSLAYGSERKFMHTGVGFNYRMTNLQAALGCAQLERINEVIENKRRVAQLYTKQLSVLPEIQLPVEKPYARNVFWMYHIVLRGFSRDERDAVIRDLSSRGIETRPAFIPYNQQEIFVQKNMTHPDACPVANCIADSGLYLPSSPNLTEDEVQYVCRELKDALRYRRVPSQRVCHSS
jgi:perosamine synthetase